MLGSFIRWNIITFSHKEISSEDLDIVHQVVVDGTSDNIDELIQTDQYDDINTTDTTKKGYYIIKLLSESYTLQKDTTYNRQIIIASELVEKSQYMNRMQENTNWCLGELQQRNNIIVTTQRNIHLCMDVMEVDDAKKYIRVYEIETKHAKFYKGILYV